MCETEHYRRQDLVALFEILETLHGWEEATKKLAAFAESHVLTRSARNYVEGIKFMRHFRKKP